MYQKLDHLHLILSSNLIMFADRSIDGLSIAMDLQFMMRTDDAVLCLENDPAVLSFILSFLIQKSLK